MSSKNDSIGTTIKHSKSADPMEAIIRKSDDPIGSIILNTSDDPIGDLIEESEKAPVGTTKRKAPSDLAEGQRLDKIRRDERIDAAINAFRDVLTPYHEKGEKAYLAEYYDHVTDRALNGTGTVHQVALQAVREVAKTYGFGNELVIKFDDAYHAKLDQQGIPQLKHSLHTHDKGNAR